MSTELASRGRPKAARPARGPGATPRRAFSPGLLFALPFLVLFVLFMLWPLVQGVWMSLTDTSLAVGALAIGVVVTHPWNLRPTLLNVETANTIGNLLLTTYVLPFWIASVLLTVGLVGAIVIAREE